MDKALELYAGRFTDGADLGNRQLARKHGLRIAEFFRHGGAFRVVDAHLCRCKAPKRRIAFRSDLCHGQILHDHSIRTRSGDLIERFDERGKLIVRDERVQRDINAHAALVAVCNGVFQRVVFEVFRIAPCVEPFCTEIHRVRTAADGGEQLRMTPHGCEDLDRSFS